MLGGIGIEVVSAQDVGIVEEPEENGATFGENALIKARFVARKTGEWALADDSGVTIDALNGEPGVRTARWGAEEGKIQNPKSKTQKGARLEESRLVDYTLMRMKDVPEGKRQATFHSVVALVSPMGEEWTFEGIVPGEIALIPQGTPREKLPFDVLFRPLGHDRTYAQMSDEEKNTLSHRGRAFGKLMEFLRSDSNFRS